MNKESSRRRDRRRKAPELSEITSLIDDARRLRLTILTLADYPLLSDPAHEAVTSLAHVTATLETITELVAAAKAPARKRRTTTRSEIPPADSTPGL
jgi:hypothetical protein